MKTPEQLAYDKARFDYLKKVTRGQGNKVSSPFNGKTSAQRRRIAHGWRMMETSKPKPVKVTEPYNLWSPHS